MATLRNKRKLAAVTREIQEEHPRNGQSRNTSVPGINEEYITQISEEIEGKVTKKLSQEYSRTEFRILGTLSKLDEFLLNQQIRMHSGTVPEKFRSTNVDNQGTKEDDSMSDPHSEAGLFRSQTTQNSGQEVGPYSCGSNWKPFLSCVFQMKLPQLVLWPCQWQGLLNVTLNDAGLKSIYRQKLGLWTFCLFVVHFLLLFSFHNFLCFEHFNF